jgi:hypothetical protein
MVVFRNATNIAITDVQVSAEGQNGELTPVTQDSFVTAGQKVQVKVTAQLEGDPLGPGVDTNLAVGWTNRNLENYGQEKQIHLDPFQPATFTVELTAPKGDQDLELYAGVNTGLIADRLDYEISQHMLPPAMVGQAAPESLPKFWEAAAARNPDTGEVWAVDNARTLKLSKGSDLSLSCKCPTAKLGPNPVFTFTVGYAGPSGTSANAELHIVVSGGSWAPVEADRIMQIGANKSTAAQFSADLPDGEYHLTATISSPDAEDQNTKNDTVSCTFTVEQCPDGDCGSAGSVLDGF